MSKFEQAIEILQDEVFKLVGKTISVKHDDTIPKQQKDPFIKMWENQAKSLQEAVELLKGDEKPKSNIITG